MLQEIELQAQYLGSEVVETIYFGGGTPSLLSISELSDFLNRLTEIFSISPDPEITIEANPDDLDLEKLQALKSLGFNRLSIGIQSFDDKILAFFNRAHNSTMAIDAVRMAQSVGFENISLDLIFGVPDQSLSDLREDIEKLLALGTPHVSIYGLTIEENTVFGKWHKQNKLTPLDEDLVGSHMELIMSSLSSAGYLQYEISNFCWPGFESRHNSSYWLGKKYLGIGPAAHSYNEHARQFNVPNNIKYINHLKRGELPCEIEVLTREEQINDMILTRIRLARGLDLALLEQCHSFPLLELKSDAIEEYKSLKMLEIEDNWLRLTAKGKLLADFITEKLII